MTTPEDLRKQIKRLEDVLQSYESQREVIARARAHADALGVCAHIRSVGPDGEGPPVELVHKARSHTPTLSQFRVGR